MHYVDVSGRRVACTIWILRDVKENHRWICLSKRVLLRFGDQRDGVLVGVTRVVSHVMRIVLPIGIYATKHFRSNCGASRLPQSR